MSEGLVVASCGLYFPMVAKSPESHTTVVPAAFRWSREEVMVTVSNMGFDTSELEVVQVSIAEHRFLYGR